METNQEPKPLLMRDEDEAAMWRQKALEHGPLEADALLREYQHRTPRLPRVVVQAAIPPRARWVSFPKWVVPGRLVRIVAEHDGRGEMLSTRGREGVLAWEPWRGIEGAWTVLDPAAPAEPLHAWPLEEDPVLHVEPVEPPSPKP